MTRLFLASGLLLLGVALAVAGNDCASLPRVVGRRGVSGPRTSARPAVPDRARFGSGMRHWRSAHFSPACRELNRCYSRLDAQRSLCDEDFRVNLGRACVAAYGLYGEERAKARCQLAVTRYYQRLLGAGPAGFRDAQYEARWMEDAGPRRLPHPKRKWRTEERVVPGIDLVPLATP